MDFLPRIIGVLCAGFFVGLSGCGAPIITADDVVLAPGQAGKFVISIDRRYGKAKVRGAEVEFLVNGQRIGRAVTDARGMAILRSRVPASASAYTVRAKANGEAAQGRGRVFQWEPSRTAVAIDIDETISATDYGSLFLTELDTDSPPLDYSPVAVRAMSSHYGIVYLSARPRWLHEKTRVWLASHGFPEGPILHASRFEACLKQEQYKREMLAEFRREFPNLLIGIGDRGIDERAYGANNMLTVILDNTSRSFADHCVVLSDWRQIEEFFLRHRGQLCDATRLRGIIRANHMNLRHLFEDRHRRDADVSVAAASPGPASASQSPPQPAGPPAARTRSNGRTARGD